MRTFPGKTHDLKPENTPCAQYNQKESTEQNPQLISFLWRGSRARVGH